jgi:hypothetical protein
MNELDQLANDIIKTAPEELQEKLRHVYAVSKQSSMSLVNILNKWLESQSEENTNNSQDVNVTKD